VEVEFHGKNGWKTITIRLMNTYRTAYSEAAMSTELSTRGKYFFNQSSGVFRSLTRLTQPVTGTFYFGV
jgi:hypothetical protein